VVILSEVGRPSASHREFLLLIPQSGRWKYSAVRKLSGIGWPGLGRILIGEAIG
jgi:hypothetical protein